MKELGPASLTIDIDGYRDFHLEPVELAPQLSTLSLWNMVSKSYMHHGSWFDRETDSQC